MQLFTSDLDRTLIFSARTVAKDEAARICVETFDGKEISYVTACIYEQLETIHQQMQFVPVTTRSRTQFERIALFGQHIVPKIAIVANGGIILRNGEVDSEWQAHMAGVMRNLALPMDELQAHFHEQLSAAYFLTYARVDELFFVYMLDLATIDLQAILALQAQLVNVGWLSYLHGRKFYIVPQPMTKGAAVQYLKEQGTYTRHYAAGDSMLDVSMMYLADRSFAPLHGEIVEYPESYRNIEIIQQNGAAFAEQCLFEILQDCAKV